MSDLEWWPLVLVLSASALTACGDKDDADDDDTGSPAVTVDQGVCGRVDVRDTGPCALPPSVGIWTVAEDAEPCDTTGLWDTGGMAWADWRDSLAAEPAVDSDGRFASELSPGDYGAFHYESCYGCVAFEVEADQCTDVTLNVRQVITADAPNIYLYPTDPTELGVRVGSPHRITRSDPPYPQGGWRVLARPDGQLQVHLADGVEQDADYLFYELRVPEDGLRGDEGWCVAGSQAQASIEDAMALMGFTDAEIEDFSDFWDPVFPHAPLLTVRPLYEGLVPLDIQPPPDVLLRAWFVVEPGCRATVQPWLPTVDRQGFHAAEWGVVLDRGLDRPWLFVD